MATTTVQSINLQQLPDYDGQHGWVQFGLQIFYEQDSIANTTRIYMRPYLYPDSDAYIENIKIPTTDNMVHISLVCNGKTYIKDLKAYESLSDAYVGQLCFLTARQDTGIVIEHDQNDGSLSNPVRLDAGLIIDEMSYIAYDSLDSYLGSYNYNYPIEATWMNVNANIPQINRATRLVADKDVAHIQENIRFDITDSPWQGTATYEMKAWRVGDEAHKYYVNINELVNTNYQMWNYVSDYAGWIDNPWFSEGQTRCIARFELSTYWNDELMGTSTIDVELYNLNYGVMYTLYDLEDTYNANAVGIPVGSGIRGLNKFYYRFYAAPVPDGNTQIISVNIRYNTSEVVAARGGTNGEYSGYIENLTSENVRIEISYWTDGEGSVLSNQIHLHQVYLNDYTAVKVGGDADGPISGDGQASISIYGNYYNGWFLNQKTGQYVQNTLSLTYELGIWGGAIVQTGTLTASMSGLSFNASKSFTGLDYKKHYYVAITAKDKLLASATIISLSGVPIFDWSHHDFHFNVPTYFSENIVLDNKAQIVGWDAEKGQETSVFLSRNDNGDTVLGQGNYEDEHGATLIYGNTVDIMAHNGVTINGALLGEHRLLWHGHEQMGANSRIDLSESTTNQVNGIVLVFSLWRNNAPEDVSVHSFFVSKKEIELLPGAPHTFMLGINAAFSTVGAKYLRINHDTITGDSSNTSSGTGASGITFNNSSFVLRYVIGC